MQLGERFKTLFTIFDELEQTPSRLEKEAIVAAVPAELKDDFYFCLEVLAGRHKIGWKYVRSVDIKQADEAMTVKQYISQLFISELTDYNKYQAELATSKYDRYVQLIVNRELKLGIGPSLLEKSIYSPMLAKKFDFKYLARRNAITEKLDGNRCIAYYDDGWHYVSRNGKPMSVEFDMSNMNPCFIYDGEILSPLQVEMSNEIVKAVQLSKTVQTKFDSQFSKTSGLINRKSGNKDLVYNVFDVIARNLSYAERRDILWRTADSSNVRILPVLARVDNMDFNHETIYRILEIVTSIGGEGIMLNNEDATYVNKRTSDLLKLKKAYTVDMKVIGYQYGTGKYEGIIGALHCEARLPDKDILCDVGTGFTDEQRVEWAKDPNKILGKIIEVEYFSLSQNAEFRGTSCYSLRFPRMVRIRDDKNDVSAD